MTLEEIDKIGLIREAYRIDGITASECRSIFLDWAMKLPIETDPRAAITRLLEVYGGDAPGHPMTGVLQAGLEAPEHPKRRGGRRGRVAPET